MVILVVEGGGGGSIVPERLPQAWEMPPPTGRLQTYRQATMPATIPGWVCLPGPYTLAQNTLPVHTWVGCLHLGLPLPASLPPPHTLGLQTGTLPLGTLPSPCVGWVGGSHPRSHCIDTSPAGWVYLLLPFFPCRLPQHLGYHLGLTACLPVHLPGKLHCCLELDYQNLPFACHHCLPFPLPFDGTPVIHSIYSDVPTDRLHLGWNGDGLPPHRAILEQAGHSTWVLRASCRPTYLMTIRLIYHLPTTFYHYYSNIPLLPVGEGWTSIHLFHSIPLFYRTSITIGIHTIHFVCVFIPQWKMEMRKKKRDSIIMVLMMMMNRQGTKFKLFIPNSIPNSGLFLNYYKIIYSK